MGSFGSNNIATTTSDLPPSFRGISPHCPEHHHASQSVSTLNETDKYIVFCDQSFNESPPTTINLPTFGQCITLCSLANRINSSSLLCRRVSFNEGVCNLYNLALADNLINASNVSSALLYESEHQGLTSTHYVLVTVPPL